MRALVTGGGGFLGRRIAELLLERGDAVRILARGRYPEVEALGADSVQGDLRDPAAVEKAVIGVDCVFHVAALTGIWGDRDEYDSINVGGTRELLAAARAAGVDRLVYTSTPSVVGYAVDVENGGRELPYAQRHLSVYPETKAAAEALALAANGPGIRSVALRPHLVFGPRDTNLMPELVRRASRRRLPMVGDGTNRVDFTFVDNAAFAHLDAADALARPDAVCAGRAYFVTNGEPVVLWEFLNGLFERLGVPRVTRRVPHRPARAVGGALEWLWTHLRLGGEPRLTRFLADALARSHWYDNGPAERELGYRVRVPLAQGVERTLDWLRR